MRRDVTDGRDGPAMRVLASAAFAVAITAGATLGSPAAWAADAEAREGAAMMFMIDTYLAPSNWSYRWSYRTEGRSATGGQDFEPVSGQVTFGPGESRKSISVKTNTDCDQEGDEFLVLKFHDFQMNGYYSNVEGWMTPPIQLSQEFPNEFERQGKIVDVYNQATVAQSVTGGC